MSDDKREPVPAVDWSGLTVGETVVIDGSSTAYNCLVAEAGGLAVVGQPRPSPHKPPVEVRQRERMERRRERAMQRVGNNRRSTW